MQAKWLRDKGGKIAAAQREVADEIAEVKRAYETCITDIQKARAKVCPSVLKP